MKPDTPTRHADLVADIRRRLEVLDNRVLSLLALERELALKCRLLDRIASETLAARRRPRAEATITADPDLADKTRQALEDMAAAAARGLLRRHRRRVRKGRGDA